MPSPFIRQLNTGSCRTYLIGRTDSREVALIDPLLKHADEYISLLEAENLRLSAVIDTHTHADHLSGSAKIRDLTGAAYLMHRKTEAQEVTALFDEATTEIVGIPVQVIHTPGHTQDSMALVVAGHVLTGDLLFLDEGGAGRVDLPGGNPDEHWDSLQRILGLAGDLEVNPAHDYRNRTPSSLFTQRIRNPYLQHKTKDEYLTYLKQLTFGSADWMTDVVKANLRGVRDVSGIFIPQEDNTCEQISSKDLGISTGIDPAHIQRITPTELLQLMENKQIPVLLDIREEEQLAGEYGALSGILHIRLQQLESKLATLVPHQSKTIVTICNTGNRAAHAAGILLSKGFPNVRVLEGGMKAWNELTRA